mmetsp:Transcript_139946/g.390152  ORF Transcript_139946/g.390152 Transcript_139946/m.390152 type:complete len:99 (-) Transcript_139946:217-513(-)
MSVLQSRLSELPKTSCTPALLASDTLVATKKCCANQHDLTFVHLAQDFGTKEAWRPDIDEHLQWSGIVCTLHGSDDLPGVLLDFRTAIATDSQCEWQS